MKLNWNFVFDFDINFPNVSGGTGIMQNPNLNIRGVSFNSGIFVCEIPTINF